MVGLLGYDMRESPICRTIQLFENFSATLRTTRVAIFNVPFKPNFP
jgi:hypothetical protein